MSSLTFISSIVDKISKGDQDVEIYMSERSLWIIPSMNPDTYDANILSDHVVKRNGKSRSPNVSLVQRETLRMAVV